MVEECRRRIRRGRSLAACRQTTWMAMWLAAGSTTSRNHDAVCLIRYLSKWNIHRVGYKVHLTETCDAGEPDLITQAITTPATTPDCVIGPTIHHDLAQRDLLPVTHWLD